MATANVIELEACLKDAIAFCEANPKHEFVQYFAPRLKRARAKWGGSVRDSDMHYLRWQTEVREDRVSWKRLATELKATQNQLRKLNAIGYPAEMVLYWDTEILGDAVQKMIDYLASRTDVLPMATERVETLTRLLGLAESEDSEADDALKEFKRHVLFRSEAMGTLSATLADFRVSMRRALGKRSADYQSISWPLTLAPDGPIL